METNIRIVCISDMHGQLPQDLPTADLCLIAGDICPLTDHSHLRQKEWVDNVFYNWCLQNKQIDKFVVIAGNHDFVFEHYNSYKYHCEGFEYLEDRGIEYKDLNIWGTPWQKRFFDWSFNLDEVDLSKKWSLIPKNTDIIVCHGPAYSFGDKVKRPKRFYNDAGYENVGSPSMLDKIIEIKPKLYVCGHIHSGYGVRKFDETFMVNASYVDEKYKPSNKPIVFDYNKETGMELIDDSQKNVSNNLACGITPQAIKVFRKSIAQNKEKA